MTKKLDCILLVDDNDSDNFLHSRIIGKSGLANHVEIKLNGQEALDCLTSRRDDTMQRCAFHQPELILLDINMPMMDGWEFIERYQALPEYRKWSVVIIMLTTSINPADKITAEKKLGPGCFHYKPLTLEMLREIMQRHFPDYL